MSNEICGNTAEHKLIIEKEILDIHGKFNQFAEADFYPEHEKRKESPEYRKIRSQIIIEQNSGCIICGVTNKDLSDPITRKDTRINFYQASHMELHHYHVEWALANAVDLDKFNNLLRVHLAALYPSYEIYKSPMDQSELLAWIDHHPHNLMPLCDVHHRHKYYGIHCATYPNWVTSNLYKDDFIESIKKKIDGQSG